MEFKGNTDLPMECPTSSLKCEKGVVRCPSGPGFDPQDVTVVETQFGGQSSLRIIGSSPRDDWAKAFPRFRAVRDGIQPR